MYTIMFTTIYHLNIQIYISSSEILFVLFGIVDENSMIPVI